MKYVSMPRYVDSQPKLFFWDLDEFIVFTFAIVGGIVMRELVASAILGLIVVKFFGIWKSRRLDGALMHLAYRHLNTPMNRIFDNGAIKEIIQ
jgi:conjugal transfer pilus assembly protein TraL